MTRYGCSLRLLKSSLSSFYESLPFSCTLNRLSSLPYKFISLLVFFLNHFVRFSALILVSIDKYVLGCNLFYLFRLLTRFAFIVGFLRPRSLSEGSFI